jgi:hypothetical protein
MRAFSHLASLLTLSALLAAVLPSTARAQSGFAASNYAAQQAAYARQQADYYQQQQAHAVYQQQMAAYQQQQQAYATYQQQMAAYQAQQQRQQQAPAAMPVARAATGSLVRFDGRYAAFSTALPAQVQYAVNAANYLQSKPYVRGAGHKYLEDNAYDCSSSVSYSLIKAGLLRSTLTSAGFANYGEPGPGRFITLWVKPGEHVFMTVCGLRLDTTGGREGEGPRWRTQGRSIAGFIARHPAGL